LGEVRFMSGPGHRGFRRPSARAWVVIFGPVVVLLGCFLVAVAVARVDIEAILRDPMSVLGAPPLVGVGSVIGVLIWWTAVGVCLFAAALLRRLGQDGQLPVFLVWAAAISAILSLDDQFLFHDELAEDLLGLRERYVMLIYIGMVAVWISWYRRVIARTTWIILAVSFGFFAASVGIDALHQLLYTSAHEGQTLPAVTFVEDAAKLFGIAAWTAYLVDVSFHAVIEHFPAGDPAVPGSGSSG
jgi:hypothetical protein